MARAPTSTREMVPTPGEPIPSLGTAGQPHRLAAGGSDARSMPPPRAIRRHKPPAGGQADRALGRPASRQGDAARGPTTRRGLGCTTAWGEVLAAATTCRRAAAQPAGRQRPEGGGARPRGEASAAGAASAVPARGSAFRSAIRGPVFGRLATWQTSRRVEAVVARRSAAAAGQIPGRVSNALAGS